VSESPARAVARPRRRLHARPARVIPFRRTARLGLVAPGAILLTLAAVVLVNVPDLGGGAWTFRPGRIEASGVLAPLVRAADSRWDPGVLRAAALVAGLVIAFAAVRAGVARAWRPAPAVALVVTVVAFLVLPGVLLQAGLRESTAPWFFTNDSTYQLELAGDLVLAGETPYGHDYVGSGLERFYSGDGRPRVNHAALEHFPYFPGAVLSAAGWRLLPAPLSDYRFLVALATIGLLVAALAFDAPITVRLAVGAALAANPLSVHAAWFGTADAPSLVCLVLAFGLATRSRWAVAAASLATAILLKQFALVALPFFGAMLFMSAADGATRRRSALAFAGVLAAGFAPFLLADAGALSEDTVAYGAGTYAIVGYGLAPLLVRAGVLAGRNAAYPFAALVVLVWLPVTAWLVRNQLRSSLPWVGAAGFSASIFLLFFLGRVFQTSYLLWPLAGLAVVILLAQPASRGHVRTG
jgi:hypothetical protein